MKKPLILFALLFVIVAGFFASMGMDEVHLHESIAKAPAYAPAIAEGITETKRKRSTSYHVNYTYQVAGATYKIDSKSLDKDEAMALAAKPDVEVAYAVGAPGKAVLRHDFDQRDKKESVFGAILTACGIALLMSIVATLFLSWKFGWLSRQTA